MGDSLVGGTHWCYMCEQVVTPVMEVEVKCPFCEGGFIEVMEGREENDMVEDTDLGSDRSPSLWAPILLGMLSGARSRRRRFRRGEEVDEDNEDDNADEDRELRAIMRRQRRGSAVLQLLQGLREDARPESADNSQRERDGESLILINAFNQAVILQGSFDSEQTQGHDRAGATPLGEYFVGSGLDMLLQHLAENDPNQYGTPPAKKETVDALPTVKIGENISCSVCLEDFGIGSEAREMPCQHKFHSSCILPWLELHSSCPVCRFQLPADEWKGSSSRVEGSGGDGANRGSRWSGGRLGIPVPWPFNGLFSLPGSQTSGNSSSAPSSSTSGSDSRADEN